MGQLFAKRGQASSGHPSTVDDEDMALLDLKVQRDQLVSRRKAVEKRVEKADEAARTLVKSGQRERAMLALRMKKQYEQLALDSQGHVDRLGQLIDSIEVSRSQRTVVEALQAGTAVLRKIQKDMGGVDQVQRLLGEQEEAVEAQREITAALAGEGGLSAEDGDMLAEYTRLQEEAALQKQAKGPPASAAAQHAPEGPASSAAERPAQHAPEPAAASSPSAEHRTLLTG